MIDWQFRSFEQGAPGLIKLVEPISVWSRVKVRKPHRCASCREKIDPGSYSWRPISEYDAVKRYMRVCELCVSLYMESETVKGHGRHL